MPPEDLDTPATEVHLDEQQAAQELLKRWGARNPEGEVTTEEEPTAQQPEGDAVAEEESQEEVEPGEVEIDVAGEKFKIPAVVAETAKRIEAKAKEVEAGATRKFQEAADLRKAAEVQSKAVAELQKVATANAQLLGDHAMVSRRLEQLEKIDIAATDSDTLARLNAEYNQLQAAQRRITEQYQSNVAQMRSEEAKAVKARAEHSEGLLKAHIKGWGPERQKSLAEYAMSRGAPPEVLSQITDAWMVEILDDAAYGRQMREHKSTIDKRVQDTPKTLKPSGTKTPTLQKADAAFQRAKKTGSVDDAVMALLARSSAKRR